jgi:hypothetical protein
MCRIFVVVALWVGACTHANPSSVQIGPAGGTATSSDNSLTITIPSGALASPTTITITPTTGPAGAIGTTYALGPDGTQFAVPIGLRFVLPPGSTAGSVSVGTVVDGAWQQLGFSAAGNGTLAASTTHFSLYGLFDSVIECTGVTDAGVRLPPDAPGPVQHANPSACAAPSQCIDGAPTSHETGYCAFPCSQDGDCPRGLYCRTDPQTGKHTCSAFDCSNASCPTQAGVTCGPLGVCTGVCNTAQYDTCPVGQTCFLGECMFAQCGVGTCPQGSTCYQGFCVPNNTGCVCGDPGCDCGVDAGVPLDGPRPPDAA